MTGYAGGQSVTTQYELDNGRVLTAQAGELTTRYLYGLGPIGEFTNAWSYSLPDGANTPRQMTDATGAVTLTSSYTPWGDTLASNGTGNFSTGYFGGIMDTATGLLYVGNGQYYDPQTGRFLNRNAKPDQTNPYVPWGGNPSSALIGPLALLALIFGRKKKRSKWDNIVIIAVLCLAVGMSLTGCDQPPEVTATLTQPADHSLTLEVAVSGTATPIFKETIPPTLAPTLCCPQVTAALTPMPTPTPTYPANGKQYAQMLLGAVLNHQSELLPGFSIALLLSLAAVESGGNTEPYRNSTTHGGAFQLRANSGHYHHPYEDSPEGYEQNVLDAIAVVNENYGYAAATTGEDNPTFHFLYVETYPNNPNGVTAARAVLYYNGGMGWWDPSNPNSYVNAPINKPYVGKVASMLESYVPKNFGFSDPALVNILQSVQAVVNATVP